MAREAGSSTTARGGEAGVISIETFQASDFNVAALVEGLMEEDLKRVRTEGGGEFAPFAFVFELLFAVLERGRFVGAALPPRSSGYDATVTETLRETAFDPQPSIKTLEHALSLLLPLRKANAAKTAEIERSVAAADRAYRGDVRGAKAGFEVIPFPSNFVDGY